MSFQNLPYELFISVLEHLIPADLEPLRLDLGIDYAIARVKVLQNYYDFALTLSERDRRAYLRILKIALKAEFPNSPSVVSHYHSL